MNLIDFNFYIFLLITLVVYYRIPKDKQWCFIAFMSIIYYFLLERRPLIVLIASILVTYGAAWIMQRVSDMRDQYLKDNKSTMPKEEVKAYKKRMKAKRKLICTLGIVMNIGLLVIFKYTGAFLDGMSASFGINLPIPHFVAPIGISYYIFKSSGYLLDVYRETYKAERNVAKYSLFVSFFPAVLMGPIGRFGEEKEQLFAEHEFQYEQFLMGVQRIMWGFFKKAVIADRLSGYVTQMFANYTEYDGMQLFFAVILFAIQEYADFSGCMDIVLGTASLFGIKLTENFKSPFLSATVGEFWRRWHITMGAWFRDYVFYEVICSKFCKNVAKNKRLSKYWKQAIPVVTGNAIIWVLIGFWHGASWHHVFWGIYNGVLIIAGFLTKEYMERLGAFLHIPTQSRGFKLFQRVRTFMLFALGELFFVSDTLSDSVAIVLRMINNISFTQCAENIYQYVVQYKIDSITAILSVILLFVVDVLQEKQINIGERIVKKPIWIRWPIYFACIFSIILLGIYGLDNAAAFIYMGI